ncbi:hypothetical protein EMIT07CA2_550059 [Brevibacillus sp. IT-7CA2]
MFIYGVNLETTIRVKVGNCLLTLAKVGFLQIGVLVIHLFAKQGVFYF